MIQLTKPANKAVTLEEMKEHLKIDFSDEDVLLESLIDAATLQCEKIQNRVYINRNYKILFSEINEYFHFPKPPLVEIISVKLILIDGTNLTVDSSDYLYDPGTYQSQFYFCEIDNYISYELKEMNGFEIEFTAGYGLESTDIPEDIKMAIKLLVAHWYQNRETASKLTLKDIPFGVRAILSSERVMNV